MEEIFSSPFFGLSITVISFVTFRGLYRKIRTPLLNPVLLSIIFIITFLFLLDIPLMHYEKGGSIISLFLSPAITVLAFSIYKQMQLLKKYVIAILLGCCVGSFTAVASVIFLCRLLGLSDLLIYTMTPKSVTTPIAIELSAYLGGLPSVTVAMAIISGILGAVFAQWAVKFFGVTDPVAAGVAIGTCSHGIGTAKAFEIGELEGATSGIAIGIAGLATTLIIIFI